MNSSRKNLLNDSRTASMFNAPLFIVCALFILVPVIGTMISSLYRDVTFLPEQFIAFDNFQRLLSDGHFRESVIFTVKFVAVSVSLELILGVIVALVLNEVIPGRGLFRIAVLIPWAIPVAVSARVWELMFNFDGGLFNVLVLQLGLLSDPVSWLGSPSSAFFSIVISDVWKTTPFMAVIILAGLSVIDDNLYQQAMVDGAGAVQRFFMITLPMLRPVLIVALLFRTIDAVRIFDLVYVLTGGGPGGSTTSVSLYAYNYFATGDVGYGSTIAVVLFLIASLFSLFYIKMGKFREAVE